MAAAPHSPADSGPGASGRPRWPDVFVDHHAFVHAMTRRLAGPALDPDDLTQEVFVVVHRKLASLNDASRLRSWLYGICRRVVAHQRRKLKVRRAIGELLGRCDDHAAIETPEARLGRLGVERQLYAALDRLSAKRREVLVLFALEELSGKQIAELLDIPVNTVWTRLHAARRDLAGQLSSEGVPVASSIGGAL